MPEPSQPQNRPLPREEYVEQQYFFRVYRERLEDSIPSQEILQTVQQELLSTTQLPMAVDFMRAEILHTGSTSSAMKRLGHYFTPFQTLVMTQAEEESSRFEMLTALLILEREASYRAEGATMPGLFVFQFECLARNRLGYTDGLSAMSQDTQYNQHWKKWILYLRAGLGTTELSEQVYRASAYFHIRREQKTRQTPAEGRPESLFGEQEGRIARANIGREPLYFFAALQRQLNYPEVPRNKTTSDERLPSFLEERLSKLEQRLKIVEMEQKGGIDLTRFYEKGD